MADFRYAQHCPLARAGEILGERWTLPILRELCVAPHRFTDLRRRLPGISPSVLAARLRRLERAEVVSARALPPPGSVVVYELAPAGTALAPALIELARWGRRFLEPPRRGDHFEPDWAALALPAFARSGPSPARYFELRLVCPASGTLAFRVRGGREGTAIARIDAADPAAAEIPECVVIGSAPDLLALASGSADPGALVAAGKLRVEGDLAAFADLPKLFDPARSGERAGTPD